MPNSNASYEHLRGKDDQRLKARLGILHAYELAQGNRHELADIIAASRDADEACEMLMSRWGISEQQANAVLEMRQRRFALDERQAVSAEIEALEAMINGS